ncbi:uncharacterized protein LOC120346098 isoform X2 [Styela clava]
MKNLEKKDSENCETCVKNKKLSSEYIDLRDKVILQSKQITNLMTNYAIRSVAMKQLEKRAARQSVVIKELKTDLVKVQEMNNKLMEDNNKMNKAISRIERKLAEEKYSQRQITEPTTTIQTTVKPTSLPEICKLKIGNICYFAVVNILQNVSYNEAIDICKRDNADVGLFRDEKSYSVVVNYLRNTLGERILVSVWTGIHIDPMICLLSEFHLRKHPRVVKPLSEFASFGNKGEGFVTLHLDTDKTYSSKIGKIISAE